MNCGSFSVMGVLAGGCTSCVNDQLLGMKVSVMSPVPSVPEAQYRYVFVVPSRVGAWPASSFRLPSPGPLSVNSGWRSVIDAGSIV